MSHTGHATVAIIPRHRYRVVCALSIFLDLVPRGKGMNYLDTLFRPFASLFLSLSPFPSPSLSVFTSRLRVEYTDLYIQRANIYDRWTYSIFHCRLSPIFSSADRLSLDLNKKTIHRMYHVLFNCFVDRKLAVVSFAQKTDTFLRYSEKIFSIVVKTILYIRNMENCDIEENFFP